MAKTPGISVPIYKLDLDALTDQFGEKDVDALPALIVEEYNIEKGVEVFELESESDLAGAHFAMFRNTKARPNTMSWVGFFKDTELELDGLLTQMQHLACFVIVDDELFAFTAGQAAVAFERYVDISFPIAVGRRIAKPEVKGARANPITGATLANDMHFRDSRRITHTESLDTVWAALTGSLRDEVVVEKEFVEVFGPKRKITMQVGSSLKLGPVIGTPAKLVGLIQWLNLKSDAPLPVDDGWASLDTIKVLNPRKSKKLIRSLRQALGRQIFVDHQYENLALANADVALWESATGYEISQDRTEVWSGTTQPEFDDFIRLVDVNPNDLEATFASIRIDGINDDYPSATTSGTLLAHLHGELRHGSKTYFLLAGKWYEVDDAYIEEVTKDFLNLIESLDVLQTEIGLRNWKSTEDEGPYNETSLPSGTFINGDKVLTDNTELFDSIEFAGDRLHIIHVKRGFNVKVRDVRSQLLSSAQVIENDLRSGGARLRHHYRELFARGRTPLSEAEFMALFEKPRVYVLGYGTKTQVTRATLARFRSSVARMELVSLNSQFRQVSNADTQARLALTWIKVED